MKKYKYLIIFYIILLIIIINIRDLKIKQYKKEVNILLNNNLSDFLNGIGVKENNIFRESYFLKLNFKSDSYINENYKINFLENTKYCLTKEQFIGKNKNFTFKIYGEKIIGVENYTFYKIEIYENELLLQRFFLEDILDNKFFDYSSMMKDGGFSFQDINFDGYLDIRLNLGYSDKHYLYWIFDSKENKYNYLGEYFKFDLDKENKQLITILKDKMSCTTIYYKFNKNNHLKEIKRVIKEYNTNVQTIYRIEEKNTILLEQIYKDINGEYKKIKIYGNETESYYIPRKIEVYRNNAIIQTILLENIPQLKNKLIGTIFHDYSFTLYDKNDDNYLDFLIQTYYSGYGMPEMSYFIWNEEKNCFDYLDFYEDILKNIE